MKTLVSCFLLDRVFTKEVNRAISGILFNVTSQKNSFEYFKTQKHSSREVHIPCQSVKTMHQGLDRTEPAFQKCLMSSLRFCFDLGVTIFAMKLSCVVYFLNFAAPYITQWTLNEIRNGTFENHHQLFVSVINLSVLWSRLCVLTCRMFPQYLYISTTDNDKWS